MFLLTRKGHNIKLLLSMLLHSVFRSNCLRMMVGKGLYLKMPSSTSNPIAVEFLENFAKPTENLPSAEIQLERKEAERYGVPKDIPMVTPLMDFVRQKRAANGGSRRTILNGKPTMRVSGLSSRSRVSGSLRKGLEKRASAVHVLRDSSKVTSSKESTHIVVSKQDDQQLMDKSVKIAALSNTDALEGRSGGLGSSDTGRKKILLLKKEKEVSVVSGTSSPPQNATAPAKNYTY